MNRFREPSKWYRTPVALYRKGWGLEGEVAREDLAALGPRAQVYEAIAYLVAFWDRTCEEKSLKKLEQRCGNLAGMMAGRFVPGSPANYILDKGELDLYTKVFDALPSDERLYAEADEEVVGKELCNRNGVCQLQLRQDTGLFPGDQREAEKQDKAWVRVWNAAIRWAQYKEDLKDGRIRAPLPKSLHGIVKLFRGDASKAASNRTEKQHTLIRILPKSMLKPGAEAALTRPNALDFYYDQVREAREGNGQVVWRSVAIMACNGVVVRKSTEVRAQTTALAKEEHKEKGWGQHVELIREFVAEVAKAAREVHGENASIADVALAFIDRRRGILENPERNTGAAAGALETTVTRLSLIHI